jgi:ABC-type multidrug transport system permease subunit
MALILAMPLMNQLQQRFAELAQLYLVREKPSKMYHWTTFVLSALLTEIPYNIFAGSLFFLPWFNTVSFYHNWPDNTNKSARGAYMWLMLMLFEMWISTFGQAMAALAPNPETASTLTTLFASFVILFSGVLQPFSQLISFWHWVYRASPFTYLVGGLISTALAGSPVKCTPEEVTHFNPPAGQTCGDYAGVFAQMRGNLLNPTASDDCMYCRYKSSDEYLLNLNMIYADRWRNLGLMVVYVLFNVALTFLCFYLTKVARWQFGGMRLLKLRKGRKD